VVVEVCDVTSRIDGWAFVRGSVQGRF
jgi:hypothetical protein